MPGNDSNRDSLQDIPESQWIVHSNRSRLYLWTYDIDGKPDRKLYGQLLREPGVRIDKDNHMLFLDYEIRARFLQRGNAHADISQKAIEAPFLAYVKPDVALFGSGVENGFLQWLAAEQGIHLRQTPVIGGPAVRGIFDGSDCVKAQISNYSYEVGGYICSWINYKENAEVQFCNEFNNIGLARKVDNYQRLQASGLRSAAAMARMKLRPDGHDPVVDAAKAHPMFFATNEEKQAMLAEQERKRQEQAQAWARIDEVNIQTLSAFYRHQPHLHEVDHNHVGLRYLREKQILDVVRQIGNLRVSNGAMLSWIDKESGESSQTAIHPGLLLPMHDQDGNFRNAQIIFYNRNRDVTDFREDLPGNTRQRLYMALPTSGLMYQFPADNIGQAGVPIVVAEGFSTGASLFAAMHGCARQAGEKVDIPVVVAWDAGGLSKVVPILHEKYPRSPIIIAADNDAAKTHIINSKTGKTYSNTGVEMAEKIAASLPDVVRVMIPPLPPGPHRSLDFNDVHVEQGLAAVQDILKTYLSENGITLSASVSAQHHVSVPVIPEASARMETLMQRGEPLRNLAALPAAFNANLHDYGRILRKDMIWQRGGGKVWVQTAKEKKQYVTLPEGILLPLRNFAGVIENMALYPADKGFDCPPLHLNQELQASYYPVCVSPDKRDQATVILAENFLDAMIVKQSWLQNPPTIFVCFNTQNMLDLCQAIHQKQPNKSVTLLSDFMRKNSPNHEKDNDLLENFCKKNAKNVKLCRFPDDQAATRLDLRGQYRQLVQLSQPSTPSCFVNQG